MSRLTRRQNNLQKAQARFEKVSRRSNQFQLSFERRQNENGRFRTHVRIRRGEKEYHGNNRGLLHKAVGARFRIKGDAPSVTKAINSTQPSSFKGKALKKSAQAVNFAVHDTVKTAVDAGLAAETVGLKSADTASREVINKARQKYTREAVDDYHRGIIAALKIGADAVKGTKRHFKLKKQYKLEKAKYRLKKAENKVFKYDTYKPKLDEHKTEIKSAKSELKQHKRTYKLSSKSNIQKAFLIRRKQKFKPIQQEHQFAVKKLKSEKKCKSKILKNQRKIKKNANPGLLINQPAIYTASRMKASAWQKAVNEDSDNDVMHAVDSVKRRAIDPMMQKVSKPERLQRQQKKRDKLSHKEDNKSKRLSRQENRLREKQREPPKKRKKRKQTSFSERFKESVKAFLNFVKNVYEKEVKKFFGAVLVPILLILLVFVFIIMIFSSVISGGGFTLGTYAAQDYDLSEAEKYYTKLAWDLNESIVKIGTDDWKKGLKELGVNTSDYDDTPDTKIWGRSPQFDYVAVYDFDAYKLWSFLCAYYYDFDAENGDIKYWKFDNDTEKLLDEIFKAEYAFVHYYDNTSRWEEYDSYAFEGGIDGSYWLIDSNKVYSRKFLPKSNPSVLNGYKDSDGYLHINSSLEILNAQDKNKRTGWFVQDQRYFVTDRSGQKSYPFYSWFDNKEFGRYYGNDYHPRSYWGFSDTNQIFWCVSPQDTLYWRNDLTDTCLVSYYQANYWKTDCRLYYNVKQKKTFDKVIEDKLKTMSHSDERVQYYNLLMGTDSGEMYGNHQTLKNIFGTETVRDYSVVNGFGYDMQEWNSIHCDIDDLHEGVDFALNKKSKLYAPFDCEITDVDEDNHSIVLRKDDVQYWYDGNGGTNRDTEVYLSNANLKSGLKKGDKLKDGEYFADSTGHQYCDEDYDNNLNADYVHIKVKIDTDGYGWDFIDPRLVLY